MFIKKGKGMSRVSDPMGPYSKEDITNVNIDYRGLVAFAKDKGVPVCNLSDEEENLFIKGSDMDKVRAIAIK